MDSKNIMVNEEIADDTLDSVAGGVSPEVEMLREQLKEERKKEVQQNMDPSKDTGFIGLLCKYQPEATQEIDIITDLPY